MDKLYELVVRDDHFYSSVEYDTYLFYTKKDALDYMNDLIEAYKLDWRDELGLETMEELLEDYLEVISQNADDTYVNYYIDDHCDVSFFIDEKSILKYN